MAISVTRLAYGGDNSGNSTDIVVSSFTPAANSMLVFVQHKTDELDAINTITGHTGGAAWTQVSLATKPPSDAYTMAVWACFVGASPSAGTLTITRDYTWHQEWSLLQITGVDTSGTVANAFVQTASTYGYNLGFEELTLSTFGSGNGLLAIAGNGSDGGPWAGGINDLGHHSTSTYYELREGWLASEDTTPGFTFNSWTTNMYWAAEIRSVNDSTVDQQGFRFGLDDGSESAHGWDKAEDTNTTAPLDAIRVLRLQLDGTGDYASAAFKLKYQKNGTGGYLTVPTTSTTTTPPTVEAGDCTESGNNTAETSWAVSYPAYVSGDLLIFHVASDADVTHDWPATGPNGETITTIKDSYGGTAQRASGFWFKGTATTGASTLTVTPSATEQWTAVVLKVLAGEFNSTTPIQTNTGEANDTTADTAWATPTWTTDATANGRVMCFHAGDVEATTDTPAGWTSLIVRDRGAVAATLAARTAANTASESIASVNFTKASETDSSFGYVINGVVSTNPVYIVASSNVAAGGEATTARLTAPTGKSGNFTTGRRWDDENGTDSIDIANNYYTELEWVLKVQSPAVNTDYFDFRVYNGDTALS